MKLMPHTQRNSLELEDSSVEFREKDSDFKIIVDKKGVSFSGVSNPMVAHVDLQSFAKSVSEAWQVFMVKFKIPVLKPGEGKD